MKITEAFQKLSEFFKTDGKQSLDYFENLQKEFSSGESRRAANLVFYLLILVNIAVLIAFQFACIGSVVFSYLILRRIYKDLDKEFEVARPAGKIFLNQ